MDRILGIYTNDKVCICNEVPVTKGRGGTYKRSVPLKPAMGIMLCK